jgi:predicted amidohydrolase
MKVAAYQMPVDACYDGGAVASLQTCVRACEAAGVSILCCPEGALGGLADYVADPATIALALRVGALASTLAPLASASVTLVVGFTETDDTGRWYNSAAVYSCGEVRGIYRKHRTAIRRSSYTPGSTAAVFKVKDRTIGVLICGDSTDPALPTTLVAHGAEALFIPTNNAMPADRGGLDLVTAARTADLEHARRLGVPIIRADVVGDWRGLISHGASAITEPNGDQVCATPDRMNELLVVDLSLHRRPPASIYDSPAV